MIKNGRKKGIKEEKSSKMIAYTGMDFYMLTGGG